MKRSDYEWLIRIAASVINAGDRGRLVTMDLTAFHGKGGKACWQVGVFIKKIGKDLEVERSLTWYIGEDFGKSPEDIVKEVNAL